MNDKQKEILGDLGKKFMSRSTMYYHLSKQIDLAKKYKPTKPVYFKVERAKTLAMIEAEKKLDLMKEKERKIREKEKEEEERVLRLKRDAALFWGEFSKQNKDFKSDFDLDDYFEFIPPLPRGKKIKYTIKETNLEIDEVDSFLGEKRKNSDKI
jgi:hypothetical protein